MYKLAFWRSSDRKKRKFSWWARFDRLVPSFRTTRVKLPGIALYIHIAIFFKPSFWIYGSKNSLVLSDNEWFKRGLLNNNVQVRILLCYMYNGAVLKGNIYYLHSWILSMCPCLKFEFTATIFELKIWYKYISFIERLHLTYIKLWLLYKWQLIFVYMNIWQIAR
jgi:hypothetical protein